jgi:ATP-grasp domain
VARRAAELRPPERTGLVVLAGDPAALSALAAAHPQVAELDCNPVLVGEHGAVVVDARVRVTAPPPPRLWPSLDR